MEEATGILETQGATGDQISKTVSADCNTDSSQTERLEGKNESDSDLKLPVELSKARAVGDEEEQKDKEGPKTQSLTSATGGSTSSTLTTQAVKEQPAKYNKELEVQSRNTPEIEETKGFDLGRQEKPENDSINPTMGWHNTIEALQGKRIFNSKTLQNTGIFRVCLDFVREGEPTPTTLFPPGFAFSKSDFPGSISHNGDRIMQSSNPFIKRDHLTKGFSLVDDRYLLPALRGLFHSELKSLRIDAKQSGHPTDSYQLVLRRFYVTEQTNFGAVMIFEDGSEGKVSKVGHYMARPIAWCREGEFIEELSQGLQLRSGEDAIEIPYTSLKPKLSDEDLQGLVAHWINEDKS